MNEELLYNQLYEKTKDYGRTQFVRLLMEKERENKKYKEVIDKAISHLDLFISDTGLSKYDTLKILMHTKKILKEVE